MSAARVKASLLLAFNVPRGYVRNQPQHRVPKDVPLGGISAADPAFLDVFRLRVRIILAIPGNKSRGAISTANLQGAFLIRLPCEWQIGLRFYACSSRHGSGSRSTETLAICSGEQAGKDQHRWVLSSRRSRAGRLRMRTLRKTALWDKQPGKLLDMGCQWSSDERASSVASRFSTIALMRPLIATNSAA